MFRCSLLLLRSQLSGQLLSGRISQIVSQLWAVLKVVQQDWCLLFWPASAQTYLAARYVRSLLEALEFVSPPGSPPGLPYPAHISQILLNSGAVQAMFVFWSANAWKQIVYNWCFLLSAPDWAYISPSRPYLSFCLNVSNYAFTYRIHEPHGDARFWRLSAQNSLTFHHDCFPALSILPIFTVNQHVLSLSLLEYLKIPPGFQLFKTNFFLARASSKRLRSIGRCLPSLLLLKCLNIASPLLSTPKFFSTSLCLSSGHRLFETRTLNTYMSTLLPLKYLKSLLTFWAVQNIHPKQHVCLPFLRSSEAMEFDSCLSSLPLLKYHPRAPIWSNMFTCSSTSEPLSIQPLWPCLSLCFGFYKISGNGIMSISAPAQNSLLVGYLSHKNQKRMDEELCLFCSSKIHVYSTACFFSSDSGHISSFGISLTQKSTAWADFYFLARECPKLRDRLWMFFSSLLLRKYSFFLITFNGETQNQRTKTTCLFSGLRISKIHVENTVCCLSSKWGHISLLFDIFNLNTQMSNYLPHVCFLAFGCPKQNSGNTECSFFVVSGT